MDNCEAQTFFNLWRLNLKEFPFTVKRKTRKMAFSDSNSVLRKQQKQENKNQPARGVATKSDINEGEIRGITINENIPKSNFAAEQRTIS